MRSVNLVSQNYLKISGKFFRNYSIKSTDLTANRYAIKKGHFNSPTDEDVRKFQSILEKNILLEESDVRSYNIDHFKNLKGQSKIVLKPKTTEQVSKILKHCNERRIAVCPQGGNTGVVGGSVSIFDEVIISMELMNKIEKIEEFSGVLVCQSGCILEKLNEEVRKKGMCMPLDLGSKGSCQIGGNLSTNAGGLRLLRYGSLHGSVLGLEAVTADGKILNLLSNFKKDNTGYHLKHLFIGSEGTLGVITRASINCPPASRAINLALLGIENFEKVLKIFLTAKKDLGEILSGCEMMDSGSLQCGVDRYDIVSPIEKTPFYMLVETSGSNYDHDEEKVNRFLQKLMDAKLILDGIVTNEPRKMKKIWELRDGVVRYMIDTKGYCFSYDISIPLENFYEIVQATEQHVRNLASLVCGFGHLGDSNLHLNVFCPEFSPQKKLIIEKFVYEYTRSLRGSVSAEHGIGFVKSKYLSYSKSPEAIDMMKQLKKLMDPNEILNPYKIFC